MAQVLHKRATTTHAITAPAHQQAKHRGVQSASLDALCQRHGTEHRLTKPPITDATTKAFHYTSLEELRSHLKDYLWAYNSARPLRALKGCTPIGFILEQWHKNPQHFKGDPVHYLPGPNI